MGNDHTATESESHRTAEERPPVSPVRLNALADGVFAIAMTLLVLELGVPIVSADLLGDALAEMWPEFVMYALSFLVLGVYWLIHHMIYESIERYDPTLAWLNVGYLMFAALIPFATALIVEHGALTATALTYGINLLALFLLGWAMWTYAVTRGMTAGHIDEEFAQRARAMGLVYVGLLVVALLVAFVSAMAAMVVYAAVVLAFVGFTAAGRWEAVTTVPKTLTRR